jgi:hypothetical protein
MALVGKDEKGGKWSSDLVLDLYSNLLTEMWELVSALIGEAILAYLFTLAVRKIFSALSEGVINKELFPRLFPKFKEADRIISQK